MKPLSALGRIQTGSTPLTAEDKFWGGDYPFVTPAELDQGHPIARTQRTLSEDGVAQSRLLQEGAVMVCCIGSLGKIGISGGPVVTNQQIRLPKVEAYAPINGSRDDSSDSEQVEIW
jgi:type I restriction enzyme S subunit